MTVVLCFWSSLRSKYLTKLLQTSSTDQCIRSIVKICCVWGVNFVVLLTAACPRGTCDILGFIFHFLPINGQTYSFSFKKWPRGVTHPNVFEFFVFFFFKKKEGTITEKASQGDAWTPTEVFHTMQLGAPSLDQSPSRLPLIKIGVRKPRYRVI